jgi:hypothetical protein
MVLMPDKHLSLIGQSPTAANLESGNRNDPQAITSAVVAVVEWTTKSGMPPSSMAANVALDSLTSGGL